MMVPTSQPYIHGYYVQDLGKERLNLIPKLNKKQETVPNSLLLLPLFPAKMSDSGSDEQHHDVDFDAVGSGASETFPMQASAIRKGGFIVIKGRPCKVRTPKRAMQLGARRWGSGCGRTCSPRADDIRSGGLAVGAPPRGGQSGGNFLVVPSINPGTLSELGPLGPPVFIYLARLPASLASATPQLPMEWRVAVCFHLCCGR